MSGPHSILDPVARRLLCTESCPSACGSDRLNSARSWWCGRWVPLCWRVSLLCADMALTSWLHHADVILGMPALHDDVIIMSCWRHLVQVSHMGRVNWYSGRVSPSRRRRRVWRVARVCERGQQPRRSVTAREDVSDVWFWHRFHQLVRLFLLYIVVWSKHNFDNFYFWAKIKHHFKPGAEPVIFPVLSYDINAHKLFFKINH